MLMTGLGSGIDYESMIGAIVAAERAPKENQLSRQEGMNGAEMDALKEIQNTINSFRDKVEDLNSSRELEKLKAGLSNEDVLSATVDSNAVTGEYSFNVTQLAQAQRTQLFKVTSDANFNSGSIGFTNKAGDKTVNIDIAALATTLEGEEKAKRDQFTQDLINELGAVDINDPKVQAILTDPTDSRSETYTKYNETISRLGSTGVTIEELQTAVNSDPNNDGVKATLVRSGDNISMVLNGKDTGTDNSFSVTSTPDAQVNLGQGTQTVLTAGEIALQAAQNATVEFGSMTLTSNTNKMENAIDGISLNLKAKGTVNVKVERDEASVNGTIKEFVDTYNKVMETVNTYTKSSEDGAAALSGDSATRSMVSRLRSVIGGEYTASTFNTLSQLGVTTTRQGTLEIDQKKLDKALEDDFEAVSKLFLGDGAQTGMMDSMMTVLDDYHKNGGTYDRRIDQLEYSNKRLAEEREKLDERMTAKTNSLRDYYARMDTQIAQMNQTQSMLVSMLM